MYVDLIIKSKKDVIEFLENFEKYSDEYGDFTCKDDVNISGYPNGKTTITKMSEDKFSVYNFGQNWRDRENSELNKEEMTKNIWANRKNINQKMKEGFY